MNFTEFGQYRFSQLTFGTVQLGLPYGISNETGIPARQETEKMLNLVLKSGINTLDTAREYGASEDVLGSFVDNYPGAANLNIVSKFKIAPDNLDHLERAWLQVHRSVKESLATLHVPVLPVCLLHKGAEPIQKVMQILPEIIRRLKEEGLISIGGLSAYFPEDIPWILEEEQMAATQVPLNIFDQRLIENGSLERLRQARKLVFVRSVFLQGLFFMQPAHLNVGLKGAGVHLYRLQEIAMRSGMTIAQLAFSFVRDLPGVHSIVFGAVNASQVGENISLLNGPPVATEFWTEIRDAFSNVDEYILTPGRWSR
jgi:aryl-alcohol dehydrogenase-like predicted oxidoreductase